jgi:hypothetical protein
MSSPNATECVRVVQIPDCASAVVMLNSKTCNRELNDGPCLSAWP